MVFPCFCYKCARYLSLESLYDKYCLAMEKKVNCEKKNCYECHYSCDRYTEDDTGIWPGAEPERPVQEDS
ncbi:MAG: hypothetical protein ACOY31_12210 [Bacillota bacterium]